MYLMVKISELVRLANVTYINIEISQDVKSLINQILLDIQRI
jgi:hypothetical protein